MARELQREVGLDSSADLSAVAVKQLPAAMRALLAQNVAGHLPNLLLTILAVAEPGARIGGDQDAVEHDVFGGERDVGLKLRPPVSFQVLLRQQVRLGAMNGVGDA
jgi:hypothetical protein